MCVHVRVCAQACARAHTHQDTAELSEHYFQEFILSSHVEILGLELRSSGSRASTAILSAYICF